MSTRLLPTQLHTQAQARALDRQAIAAGTPASTLMQRAGRAAFELLRESWPDARRLGVFCGGGNNGGDAYVVARLALDAGMEVYLQQTAPLEKLPETAHAMATAVLDDAALQRLEPQSTHAAWPPLDVIVDGMLGIGIKGRPRPDAAATIRQINASRVPVLSLDVPSGLDGDSGHACGEAVVADVTLTFIGVKRGLLTGHGARLAGQLYYDDLQLSAAISVAQDDAMVAATQRVVVDDLLRLLPARRRDAHKGDFGHLLLVGGDYGFGGAIMLAARAALRCGAGLVSVATRAEHLAPLLAQQPEVMVHSVTDAADLNSLLKSASVVVAGPGLGKGAWGQELLAEVLACGKPQLLDADALNLLAVGMEYEPQDARVFTPHPGEAARLLDTSVVNINADRFESVTHLQRHLGGVALLKGAGTLVAALDQPIALIAAGNPGMATAGMGDILSGMIGALLAQGLSAYDATRLGALLHALAADTVAAHAGERGLVATDLLGVIRPLVNGRF